jgi:hypothetical protein
MEKEQRKKNGIQKRSTKERRYDGKGTNKKDNEDGKSEGIILEHSGFKKKKKKNFGTT